jgi:hypothetical protein
MNRSYIHCVTVICFIILTFLTTCSAQYAACTGTICNSVSSSSSYNGIRSCCPNSPNYLSCNNADCQCISAQTCSSSSSSSTTTSTLTGGSSSTVTYSVVVDGYWSDCSLSCGGGVQTRSIYCRGSDGLRYPISSCSTSAYPTSQTCNTQLCSSSSSTMGTCTCHCGRSGYNSPISTLESDCTDANCAIKLDSSCGYPQWSSVSISSSSSPSSSSSSGYSTLQIVCAAAAFAAVIILILVVVVVCYRRRRNQRQNHVETNNNNARVPESIINMPSPPPPSKNTTPILSSSNSSKSSRHYYSTQAAHPSGVLIHIPSDNHQMNATTTPINSNIIHAPSMKLPVVSPQRFVSRSQHFQL